MAFRRKENFEQYTCLSTDIKTTTGIALDSICTETDTGDEYIFNGAAWAKNKPKAATEVTLAALEALLTSIKNTDGIKKITDTVNTQLIGSRGAVIAHRTAITTADKVPVITITAADQPATAGSLTAVAHGIGVAPGNSYGSAGVSALVTVTPTVNKSIDITIPQATGAEYYEIFVSTSTSSPQLLARITEEQRATGCAITAAYTVGAGGSAGVVNIQVVGTGNASTAAPFVANNAYIPTGVTAVSCAGKTKAYIYLDLTIADLRSAPAIEINPFMQNNDSESTKWFQIESQAIAIMNGATGQPLPQVFVVDVNSARNLIILIGAISGQGASVNITIELF